MGKKRLFLVDLKSRSVKRQNSTVTNTPSVASSVDTTSCVKSTDRATRPQGPGQEASTESTETQFCDYSQEEVNTTDGSHIVGSSTIANAALLRSSSGSWGSIQRNSRVFVGLKKIVDGQIQASGVDIVTFGSACINGKSLLITACSCDRTDASRSLFATTSNVTDFDEIAQIGKCDHVSVAALLISDTSLVSSQIPRLKQRISEAKFNCHNNTAQFMELSDMTVPRYFGHRKSSYPLYLVFGDCDNTAVPATEDQWGHLRCLWCNRNDGNYCHHTNHLASISISDAYPEHPGRFRVREGPPDWKSISTGPVGAFDLTLGLKKRPYHI